MPAMVKRIEGHYAVQKVPFGKVYRWHPKHAVLECGCGETLNLTATTTCLRCDADHEASTLEKLPTQRLTDETLHPWRYAEDREDGGMPC